MTSIFVRLLPAIVLLSGREHIVALIASVTYLPVNSTDGTSIQKQWA